MAENLKCSHCNNPATVHLTQIVNNKIIKVDLCESCAQAKGVTDPEGFSLADLPLYRYVLSAYSLFQGQLQYLASKNLASPSVRVFQRLKGRNGIHRYRTKLSEI